MFLKKVTVVVLSVICLCTALAVPASAETQYLLVDTSISPYYSIAYNAESNLDITGTTAYCSSQANSDSAVSITVEQTLQKFWGLWIWDDVAGWTTTKSGRSICADKTKSGLSSGTYRLKSVFTLTTSSGKTETITIYSDEKTI